MDLTVYSPLLDGPKTAKELGISSVVANGAEKSEILQRKSTRKVTDADGNPSRGRPAVVWALTPKARKRVKTAVKRAEQSA